jgi:hypothetical protein
MKLPFCAYEEKVAELLRLNSWPESADPKLAAHAETCSLCRDVILTSRILKQGHSERMMMAHTVSPHYLWWRAQLRRRNSSIEKVTKPLALAEILALGCILCVVAGIVFGQLQPLGRWIERLSDNLGAGDLWSAVFIQITMGGSLIGYTILAAIAAFACIGGLTLWMSGRKE